MEVDRSDRQDPRRQGKSDPFDAVSAARTAQSGKAHGAPKGRDSSVEAIRVLMVAKRTARSERTQTINQARAQCRVDVDAVTKLGDRGDELDTGRGGDPVDADAPLVFNAIANTYFDHDNFAAERLALFMSRAACTGADSGEAPAGCRRRKSQDGRDSRLCRYACG